MYTLNVPAPEINVCNPFGDFVVYKDFTITKQKQGSQSSPQILTGIVVQCIEKTTTVTDAAGTVYNTTQDINALTSNQVNYSNQKYLEYFKINSSGQSINGDHFQNGPVVQYEQKKKSYVPHTYDKDDVNYNTYKTAGEIVMVGENWFISSTHPNYRNILLGTMGWIKTKNTPANGLDYMEYTVDKYTYLKSCASSNIITHRVVATWTHDDPNTVVNSNITRGRGSRSPIISTKTATEIKQPSKSKKIISAKSAAGAGAAGEGTVLGRGGGSSCKTPRARRGGRHRRFTRYNNNMRKTLKMRMN